MQASRNPIIIWKSSRKLASSGDSSDSLHLSDLAIKGKGKGGGGGGGIGDTKSTLGSAHSSDHNSGSTHSSNGSNGIGDSFKMKRDSVFKSFRMSLQAEEVGASVSRSSSVGSASTNLDDVEEKKVEYVEVGVNELYQHKLGQCIFSATEREEFAISKSRRHLLIDDHSPALKPLDRRRVRDSMQSLVSIERQMAKNRVSNGNGACDGTGSDSGDYEAPLASESPSVLGRIRDDHSVALKPMDRRRVRDSMQSLVSIERQLAKNYLAQPQPTTGNGSKSASQSQTQPQPAVAAPSPSAPRRGRRGSVTTRRRRASLTALSLDNICEDEAQVDASVPSAGTNSHPTTTGADVGEEMTFRLRDDQGNDLMSVNFHRRRTSCASGISSLGDSAATSNASSTGDWSLFSPSNVAANVRLCEAGDVWWRHSCMFVL